MDALEKIQNEGFAAIAKTLELFGWMVAISKNPKEIELKGVIMGEKEFIEEQIKGRENEFTIYTKFFHLN